MTVDSFITDLVLAPSRQLEARRGQTAFDELGEIEQQFQFTVSGSGGSIAAASSVDLEFDVEFVNARYQRYSNLSRPQILTGISLDSEVDVFFSVAVTAWTIDDRDVITGATVRVSVVSPGTEAAVPFTGTVHICFQGYGSVSEPSPGD